MHQAINQFLEAAARADRVALVAGIAAALLVVGVVLCVAAGFAVHARRSRPDALWLFVAALLGIVAYGVALANVSRTMHTNAVIAFAKSQGCSRVTAEQVLRAEDQHRLTAGGFEELTLFLIPRPMAYPPWVAFAAAPVTVAGGLLAGIFVGRRKEEE
jgi:hypothetical protein